MRSIFTFLLLLALMVSGKVWGQTTIFSESMGTVSNTTTIVAHETANGFDNDEFTMTSGGAANPADIRNTSASTGYTGASGSANVWFTNTSGNYGFAIEGINASAYTSLTVQFGYRKESASALPTLAFDYWNGTAWVNVTFTFNEAANASVAWYLSPVISLPEGAQINGLKIRWIKSGTVAVRIDDVIMKGTPLPPSITLNNNSQITVGNVNQGETNHILSRFRANVATANATLNQLSFNAGGSFVAGDVTNFKLYTSTSNSFPGGSALSTVNAASIASGGTVTFSSLSQACNIGDRYFWITADISGSANAGNTLSVPSLSASNFTFASGTPTGTIDAGGAQTIIEAVPEITLSSPSPSASDITQGQSNQVIYRFDLAISAANATLNGVTITTSGTYAAADLTNLKCWYSSDNSFDSGTDELLSTKVTSLGAGAQIFPSFTSKTITSGTTGYVFITVDLPVSATEGNTISVDAITTSDISFVSGNKSGTASASGTKTIIACTPTNVSSLSLTPGNTQIAVSWSNPSCFDEIMIVAKPGSSISASPSGDGSAYTASLSFGSGTAFDGTGYVVYKGSTSPQTITGLTNGTTYYVKAFTRRGTVWSDGAESSSSPDIVVNTYTWSISTTGTSWVNSNNWTGGPSNTFPGVDANGNTTADGANTDIANFATLNFSGNNLGLNFNSGNNTGVGNNGNLNGSLTLGALHFSNISKNLNLGKSDNSSISPTTLYLTGSVINSVNNTVIRHNTAINTATIAGFAGGTSGYQMQLALNNVTNNIITIDNTGNLVVSCVITSALGPVTISGSGSGSVEFTGQNTYTSNTNVNGSTLRLNRTGGNTLPATNNITVNGGTLRISSNQTLNDLTLASGGTLTVDAGVTLQINGTFSVNENATIAGNLTIASGGDLTVASGKTLTINGTLALNESVTLAGNLAIGSGGTAEIAVNKSLTVSGTLSNSGTLTIKSDASGTGSLIHNTNGVSATVERYVAGHGNAAAEGWHLMGSPVATFNITGSSFQPGTNDDLYAWSESTNTWLNYKAGNPTQIVPGTGYLLAYENTGTKSFSGTLHVSDVSVSGLAHNASQGKGWHLLGNPFASALEWNKTGGSWTLTNIAGTAKIWNSTSKTYTDITANGIIPSAQGFFVQVAESTTGSLTIPSAARAHSATGWYKNTTPRILLSASPADGSSRQESQIRLEPEATSGFDFYWDSRFLEGYAPKFYSIMDNEKLSTNAMPVLPNGTSIPFGFEKNQHSSYVIRLEESLPGETIFLKDLKLNTVHNLSQNPEYLFSAVQGDDPNRFLLVFGTVGVDEKPANRAQLQAYMANGLLWVNNPAENSQLAVFDLSGRLLMQQQLRNKGLQQLSLNLQKGAYILRLTEGNSSLSTKVINQ